MPTYNYVAQNRDGKEFHGKMNVSSHHDLAKELENQGLFLTTWKEVIVPATPQIQQPEKTSTDNPSTAKQKISTPYHSGGINAVPTKKKRHSQF